eukprot:gene21964-26456_t
MPRYTEKQERYTEKQVDDDAARIAPVLRETFGVANLQDVPDDYFAPYGHKWSDRDLYVVGIVLSGCAHLYTTLQDPDAVDDCANHVNAVIRKLFGPRKYPSNESRSRFPKSYSKEKIDEIQEERWQRTGFATSKVLVTKAASKVRELEGKVTTLQFGGLEKTCSQRVAKRRIGQLEAEVESEKKKRRLTERENEVQQAEIKRAHEQTEDNYMLNMHAQKELEKLQ